MRGLGIRRQQVYYIVVAGYDGNTGGGLTGAIISSPRIMTCTVQPDVKLTETKLAQTETRKSRYINVYTSQQIDVTDFTDYILTEPTLQPTLPLKTFKPELWIWYKNEWALVKGDGDYTRNNRGVKHNLYKAVQDLEADTVLFPQAIAIIESMPALGDVGAYEKAVRHLEQLTPIALETYLGE